MSKEVKKYSSDFKLKVVLRYLSEKNTCSQICNEFSVSAPTLHKWVKQFKSNSSLIFNESGLSGNKSLKQKESELNKKEIASLYSKIGQLTMERDFLKKVLDA